MPYAIFWDFSTYIHNFTVSSYNFKTRYSHLRRKELEEGRRISWGQYKVAVPFHLGSIPSKSSSNLE